MNIEPQNIIYILAALAMIIGGYSVVVGKLTFYPGEDQSLAQSLQGGRARFIGILLLISSMLLLSGSIYGYVILVVALVLPLFLSKTKR
jgi:hypothetical protein